VKTFSKNAGQILQGDTPSDLRFLATKITALQNLQQKISLYLEPEMRKHAHVGNLTNGKLIFITANGASATQVRLHAHDLIKKFSRDPFLKHITAIECKINPNFHLPHFRERQVLIKPMNPLSAETATLILEMAQSLADPELRKVMERIAKRKSEDVTS
jgi:hypothetical protein